MSLKKEETMAGSNFLLSMAIGAVLSCTSYSVAAYLISKRHIGILRAISWGGLGTLLLMLGVSAFSAVGAEHPPAKQDAACLGNSPECYAKAHHNPVKECKQMMDKKATFRHTWLENEVQPVFDSYLWHDENIKSVQAFGHQANVINSLGMLTPLQYFCIFNANNGEVIAASFE